MKVVFLALILALSQSVFAATVSLRGSVLNIRPCAWYQPRISEHDPAWSCASVEEVPATTAIPHLYEVVFPGSGDVAWASWPKLKVGQSGAFVLNDKIIPGRLVLKNFVAEE